MAQIKVTPEELRNAANTLQTENELIADAVQAIKDRIDTVTGDWEGEAQRAFLEIFEGDLYPILHEQLPQVLECIAVHLATTADTIEDADKELADAFKK